MPAKYVYKEEVSEGPRIEWDLPEIVTLVRFWDLDIPVRLIAAAFETTNTNIRRRVALLRKAGVRMKSRSNKTGAISKHE